MPSVVQQVFVLSLCFASGVWALKKWQPQLSPWAWKFLDLLPPVVACLGAGYCGLLFHELARVKLTPETSILIWAGAQLTAVVPALFWGRLGAVVSGLWLVVLSAMSAGDTLYYRFFGALPSLQAVGSGGQIWEIRDSAAEVARRSDLIFLGPAWVGLLLVFAWPSKAVLPGVVRGVVAALLALFFAIGARPIWEDTNDWMASRLSWKVFSSSALIREAGIWGAHARDTARVVRELREAKALSPARLDAIYKYSKTVAVSPRTEHFGQAQGANVLIVQVEAMQAWAAEASVNGELVMPFLSKLRERAVYYDNIWDQTGGSPTSDCEYMVHNSQHPLQQGAVAFRRAGNDFRALPELLAEHGYATFSAHGYNASMWNRSILHPRYGFQTSAFAPELGKEPKMGWGLSDEAFFERSFDRIHALPSPWLAFLVTLTSHHPYNYIPKPEQSLKFTGLGATLGGYLHSMHYVDRALEQLFARLEKEKLAENTLVVIYGDHDSKIKFDKAALNAAMRQVTPKGELSALSRREFATKKIPLFIVPPMAHERLRVSAIGGQIDIGPTLLDWLGYEKPSAFVGRALAEVYPDAEERLCVTCGMATRTDGSSVNRDLLWDAPAKRCIRRASGKVAPAKLCEALRRTGEKQLKVSWDITLHDLAAKLTPAPWQ